MKKPVSKFAFQMRNLQRYTEVEHSVEYANRPVTDVSVGRCRLNQVDPYPITYSLSNP